MEGIIVPTTNTTTKMDADTNNNTNTSSDNSPAMHQQQPKSLVVERGQDHEQERRDNKKKQEIWKIFAQNFNIDIRRDVVELQQYLQRYQREIAAENLRGQCTVHHSCKESTKQQLLLVGG